MDPTCSRDHDDYAAEKLKVMVEGLSHQDVHVKKVLEMMEHYDRRPLYDLCTVSSADYRTSHKGYQLFTFVRVLYPDMVVGICSMPTFHYVTLNNTNYVLGSGEGKTLDGAMARAVNSAFLAADPNDIKKTERVLAALTREQIEEYGKRLPFVRAFTLFGSSEPCVDISDDLHAAVGAYEAVMNTKIEEVEAPVAVGERTEVEFTFDKSLSSFITRNKLKSDVYRLDNLLVCELSDGLERRQFVSEVPVDDPDEVGAFLSGSLSTFYLNAIAELERMFETVAGKPSKALCPACGFVVKREGHFFRCDKTKSTLPDRDKQVLATVGDMYWKMLVGTFRDVFLAEGHDPGDGNFTDQLKVYLNNGFQAKLLSALIGHDYAMVRSGGVHAAGDKFERMLLSGRPRITVRAAVAVFLHMWLFEKKSYG